MEWRAIHLAKINRKHSVAFLDHWVNYPERFVRQGKTYLPDEIWVGDTAAAALARETFDRMNIKLVPNPYFQDITVEIKAIPPRIDRRKTGANILYVCEPIRDQALCYHGHERYWGYTEEDAVTYFLTNVAKLNLPIEQIVFRPHPSEHPNKYDWILTEYSLPITIERNGSLVSMINASDIVVGCETMAMAIGLLAGKRVISCVPPGGRSCSLPHEEIEHLHLMGKIP